MKFIVRVKPNSKEARIEKTGDNELLVRVKAPPKEGRANEALIRLLSEYFGVSKGRINIVKGCGSRTKVVEII